MKQSALPLFLWLASLTVCFYAAETRLRIGGLLLTEASPSTIHHRLFGSSAELKRYEGVEETPEHQRELYEYLKGIPLELRRKFITPEKVAKNFDLADLLLSQADFECWRGFTAPHTRDSIISDIYRGLTTPNSAKNPKECHLMANKMLKYVLLKTADTVGIARFFVPYLQVADFEDVRDLCNDMIASIFSINRPASVYSELQSWCSAMLQNPNMSVAFAQSLVFGVTESECYKTKGVCNDEELHKMMMAKFEPHFNLDNAPPSGADFDKVLKKKLSETDFDKITSAFKRFATAYRGRFDPSSGKDRRALNALLTDRTPRFMSLKNAAEKKLWEADPKTIKVLLEQCSSNDMLVGYFRYGPPSFLACYLEMAKAGMSKERQVKLYQFFLSGGYAQYPNIFSPETLKSNPILAGLMLLKCSSENSIFWDAFPRVRDLLLLKESDDASGNGKEKEKEVEGEEGEKKGRGIKQDMDVVYRGNLFSEDVEDGFFSSVYRMKRDGQEIGKPLALAMLKNAFANYNGWNRISEKLRLLFAVADTDGLDELCQILSEAEGDGAELKIWKQHCVNLKMNRGYNAAILQPTIFNITECTCFSAEDGCTDSDLHDIFIEWTTTTWRRVLNINPIFVLRKLSFQKIVELLKEAAVTMKKCIDPSSSESWDALVDVVQKLPLLLDPSELEISRLEHAVFAPSPVYFFQPSSDQTMENLEEIYTFKGERQIFERIIDLDVAAMIVKEYDKLPQGILTGNFASDIMNWVVGQFLQKFPDHFLNDTLRQVKLNSIDEQWIIRLARWYGENKLHGLGYGLTRKDLLHKAVTNLVMHGLGDVESIVKAQIVAESAGITDFEAQNLVAEALKEYSDEKLLGIFQKLPGDQELAFFVAQPHLFPIYEPQFAFSKPREWRFGLGMMGVSNSYVLKLFREAPQECNRVLIGLLTTHKKLLHWKSQDDWAILENALVQNDPHCYEKVNLTLKLTTWERGHVKKVPSINCTKCVSFEEVEAAVRREIKPILKKQLEIDYAERYQSGLPSQVEDFGLKAIVYFNRWKFEGIFQEEQDHKVAITKAFWSKFQAVPEELREELEKKADLVCIAISDWHQLYTEARFGIEADLSLGLRSCLLYVLLRDEITQGLNRMTYQKLLKSKIGELFHYIDTSDTGGEVIKHYKSVDELREIFEAFLRDPAAEIAIMQPLLNVPKPWSLTDIRTAISEKAPSELDRLFRERLMIAPLWLLMDAFGTHLRESKRFFDPKNIGDWVLLEKLMVRNDGDCALAIIQVSGDLPFTIPAKYDYRSCKTYQEIFGAAGLGPVTSNEKQ
jgi:hypothetical protein